MDVESEHVSLHFHAIFDPVQFDNPQSFDLFLSACLVVWQSLCVVSKAQVWQDAEVLPMFVAVLGKPTHQ